MELQSFLDWLINHKVLMNLDPVYLFFNPDTDPSVMTKSLDSYKKWTPFDALRHYFTVYGGNLEPGELAERESEIKDFATKSKTNAIFFKV